FLERERGFDLRVAVCLGLADLGIALYFGGSAFTESVEVALFVRDLLDGEGVHADAHFFKVTGCLGCELLGEAEAVVIDLFDGERAEDGAEVAFERLEDKLVELLLRHSQKALDRKSTRLNSSHV